MRRVEYHATNCASIACFDLIVNPLPVFATSLTSLEMCDNDDDGDDNNGIIQSFMLTDKDDEILAGQAGIASYHLTESEAEEGINALSGPFTRYENLMGSLGTNR